MNEADNPLPTIAPSEIVKAALITAAATLVAAELRLSAIGDPIRSNQWADDDRSKPDVLAGRCVNMVEYLVEAFRDNGHRAPFGVLTEGAALRVFDPRKD